MMIVRESLNFERGQEPKEAMKIGMKATNPFNKGIKSISFKKWLDDRKSLPIKKVFWKALKKVAEILNIKDEEVLMAIGDNGDPLPSWFLDSYSEKTFCKDQYEINERYWLNYVESGEIYLIDSEEAEEVFMLGRIYI